MKLTAAARTDPLCNCQWYLAPECFLSLGQIVGGSSQLMLELADSCLIFSLDLQSVSRLIKEKNVILAHPLTEPRTRSLEEGRHSAGRYHLDS